MFAQCVFLYFFTTIHVLCLNKIVFQKTLYHLFRLFHKTICFLFSNSLYFDRTVLRIFQYEHPKFDAYKQSHSFIHCKMCCTSTLFRRKKCYVSTLFHCNFCISGLYYGCKAMRRCFKCIEQRLKNYMNGKTV